MNLYLMMVLLILIGHYLFDTIVEILNLRHLSPQLPAEFQDTYDADRYGQSQRYLRETTRFDLLAGAVLLAVTVAFILAGGFRLLDQWVCALSPKETLRGLAFIGGLALAAWLLHTPLAAYHTFVIEARYGFNRTTWRTFVLDGIKSVILLVLIGAPLLAAILWLFAAAGSLAWIYVWGAVTLYELLIVFLAPALIMPLFHKFTPLEEGDLKRSIETYLVGQRFHIQGLYTLDGSRRSTKTNAFFTGIGRFRRIALFDTLIAQHTVEELTAILAHEVGHFSRRHIWKGLAVSILCNGLMFWLLSLCVHASAMSQGIGVPRPSLYAQLVVFGFLYTPLATALGIAGHALSRRHEYEADTFAAQTYGRPEALVSALKKLSRDNLSNLTPHPFKVFLTYSHPPVLDRIRVLRDLR
jgi:STE24 endopeptidase